MIQYRLKGARKMSGLSLRESALKLGMSHEGLRKYENGKIKIDSAMLLKFAKHYNVSPEYLLPSKRPEIKFTNVHFF